MEVMSGRSLVVAVAVAVAAVLLLASRGSNAELQDCQGGGGVIAQCQQYVRKGPPPTPPSNDCCRAVQAADLQCLCKEVTPPIGALIDIGKVCYVVKTCGVSTPPAGSKCGSLVVPNNC